MGKYRMLYELLIILGITAGLLYIFGNTISTWMSQKINNLTQGIVSAGTGAVQSGINTSINAVPNAIGQGINTVAQGFGQGVGSFLGAIGIH